MTNGPCSIVVIVKRRTSVKSVWTYRHSIRVCSSTGRYVEEFLRRGASTNTTDFRIHLVTRRCSLLFDLRAGGHAKWQSLADKIHLDNTLGFVPEAAKLLEFAARGYHCHAQDTSQVSFHLPSLFIFSSLRPGAEKGGVCTAKLEKILRC